MPLLDDARAARAGGRRVTVDDLPCPEWAGGLNQRTTPNSDRRREASEQCVEGDCTGVETGLPRLLHRPLNPHLIEGCAGPAPRPSTQEVVVGGEHFTSLDAAADALRLRGRTGERPIRPASVNTHIPLFVWGQGTHAGLARVPGNG